MKFIKRIWAALKSKFDEIEERVNEFEFKAGVEKNYREQKRKAKYKAKQRRREELWRAQSWR